MASAGSEHALCVKNDPKFSAFRAQIERIPPEGTWEDGARFLQELVRSRTLLYTDMRDNPSRFFAAHRITSEHFLGGFGTRFTVQFNLFAGSIIGMGSEDQVRQLEELQNSGTLGCFGLTEVAAGVNSGLVVETTATWNSERGTFLLHTPHDGARKNWISQGLAAEIAVVIASLIVDGANKGPHAFLMRMRDADGKLFAGVEAQDMGRKTTANELDNAVLRFTNVELPQSALLDKYAGFDGAGRYETRGIKRMGIEVIGQRLLTGRLVIAQMTVGSGLLLLQKVRQYAENRKVWSPVEGADARLANVPHIADLFERAQSGLAEQQRFSDNVEQQLWPCLQNDTLPSAKLAEAIGVAKIRGVGTALRFFREAQAELGSHALMAGPGHSGFLFGDILLVTKFAEGDSRILMQKMARDRLRDFQHAGWRAMAERVSIDGHQRAEAALCIHLGRALSAAQAGGLKAIMAAWDREWRSVYRLAELICDRYQREISGIGGARL
jgi:acyl-CoA oxidase